jgi:fluoride exporter
VTRFLLVCLGGAAGTGARYLAGVGAARWLGATYPFGTLAVNVLGSFALSVVMDLSILYGVIPQELRVVLAAGVLGGFTTYSSFNYEVLALLERGLWGAGALYFLATVAGCLGAGVLGTLLARLAA